MENGESGNQNTAPISAPLSQDSDDLRIIRFDCSRNTIFSDFEATFSLTDSLIHIKNVVLTFVSSELANLTNHFSNS